MMRVLKALRPPAFLGGILRRESELRQPLVLQDACGSSAREAGPGVGSDPGCCLVRICSGG